MHRVQVGLSEGFFSISCSPITFRLSLCASPSEQVFVHAVTIGTDCRIVSAEYPGGGDKEGIFCFARSISVLDWLGVLGDGAFSMVLLWFLLLDVESSKNQGLGSL